jgi:hypothetical protein
MQLFPATCADYKGASYLARPRKGIDLDVISWPEYSCVVLWLAGSSVFDDMLQLGPRRLNTALLN